MKDDHQKAIDEMRKLGFAIVIWYPEELHNIPPLQVEDAMVERGSEFIEAHT